MRKIRDRVRQFWYRLRKDFLTLNNVVLVVALVLCGSWVWASVTTMTRNWELERKLQARELERVKLGLEIEKMELEQEWYRTEEFLELQGRSKLGKMLPGETMVVLPENSRAAVEKWNTSGDAAPAEVSNFDSWMGFLFPKSS